METLYKIISSEATIALITIAIPAFIAAYYKYKEKKSTIEAEKDKYQREVALAQSGKDFISYLKVWNDIEKDIENLLNTSCLDRFVMLRAWNGTRSPEYTSAVYQYKTEDKNYVDYNSVELDKDYKDRMSRMYHTPQSFSVNTLPECLIKNIYLNEGVKSSVWFYIISNDIEGVQEKSTTYCSFSTSHVDLIDDVTIMRAQLLVSKIKAVMHRFRGD